MCELGTARSGPDRGLESAKHQPTDSVVVVFSALHYHRRMLRDSATAKTPSIITRNLKVLRIAGVSVVLVLVFNPAIATIFWHLVHGRQIVYRGSQFAVPFRWSARIGSGAVYFEKRPVTVLVRPVMLAWAAIAPIPHPPQTNAALEAFYANFAAIYWTNLLSEQEIQQGPIRVGDGDRQAFCMLSVRKDWRDWSHVTCLVSRGTWSVDFQGNSNDKVEFFHEVLDLPEFQPPEKH